jgi:hypothetical protein
VQFEFRPDNNYRNGLNSHTFARRFWRNRPVCL